MRPARPATRLAAAAGLAALLVAAPCAAQVRVAPLELARFQLGPLQLTPTFEVRNLGIDSNVFNAPEARRRDANLVVNPGLRAYAPLGSRLRLGGDGLADVAWFSRESDQRYLDLRGRSTGELDLGPLTLFAGASGGRTRSRFSIEIDERVRRRSRELSGGVGLRLGARTLLILEALSGRERIDEGTAASPARGTAIRVALDRDIVGARGELRHRLTDKTTALVIGEGFEERFVADPLDGAESRHWKLQGGFQLEPSAVVGGRVLVGVVRFPEGSSQVAPVYDGLALDAVLQRTLTWFARAELSARRDVAWAVNRGRVAGSELRNSYVSEQWGGGLSFALPGELLLRTNLRLERARYLLPVARGAETLERVDRRWTLRGALLVPVGERFRIGGAAAWSERRSSLPGVEYQGWSYGLAAELIP